MSQLEGLFPGPAQEVKGDSEGGETDLPPEYPSLSYLYTEVLHRGVGKSRLKNSVQSVLG